MNVNKILTLYTRPTCPFLDAAREWNSKLKLKYIRGNPVWTTELIEQGGKQQMPYLVDDEREEEMYKSADIIEFLKQHYVH